MTSINEENCAIPPGSRILVTGANGFIGSQVVQQLLSLGYLVRGTVRSQKPWLEDLFKSKFGPNSFESVIIPDLSDLESLSKAMKDVSGVIHVASDVTFNPNVEEVIPKVVLATETVLEAAAKQPKGLIRRVVLTSSASAAALPQPGVEGIVVTEDTWNTATIKAAYDESTPTDAKPFTVYVASKTESELAAWKWIKENKPMFAFNAVLPYYTLGRVLHSEISGSTMKWAANLLKGDSTAFGFPGRKYRAMFSTVLCYFYFLLLLYIQLDWFIDQYLKIEYIDVVDLARVHVIGLLHPEVKSERLFAFASTFTWKEFVRILQKFRPGNTEIPSPPENELRDLSDIVPAKRAEDLVKSFFDLSGWVGLEESIRAGIDSLGY
ncbi:hypothetical protein N7462_008841 [Penicillium macrosclerotiorum]|uniref:uncharacterized protein n=1 Tax=Penicillium macrosclerotiorum TaxID=303699 RepID=UPI0025487984|nr:uncharacterized protein N7462_008841 [Penicillium macrosclerotiorum]KAJ5675944.1 hypothetical protein N7462_008841 [Penicillium macrosclerotiorum]